MNNNTNINTPESKRYRFDFKGEFGEFFGIWIVNAFLKVLTLGFYSPWAKVRTQQYFYGNTQLGGGHFQFLANPWTLFRNRLIAIAFLILFMLSEQFFSTFIGAKIIYIGMIAIYLVLAPVILVLVMSFRLRYSAWRGISFKFNKDFKGSYRVYLPPVILTGLIAASLFIPFYLTSDSEQLASANDESSYDTSAPNADENESIPNQSESSEQYDISGEADQNQIELDANTESPNGDALDQNDILMGASAPELKAVYFLPFILFAMIFVGLLPYFSFISSRFLARNSQFGTAKVKFLAEIRDYYIVYSKWLIAAMILGLLWIAVIYFLWNNEAEFLTKGSAAKILIAMSIITTACYYIGSAYINSKRYNLLLSNIQIATAFRLQANTTFMSYFGLVTVNGFILAFSFGFLRALVMVRTVRYFLERTSLLASDSLDNFAAAQHEEIKALGEEFADAFDLELV